MLEEHYKFGLFLVVKEASVFYKGYSTTDEIIQAINTDIELKDLISKLEVTELQIVELINQEEIDE